MPYKDPIKARENGRERAKRWRALHPDKVREARKKHYYKDPEKSRSKARDWYWANRDKAIEAASLRISRKRYGITEEQRLALDNICQICRVTVDSRIRKGGKYYRLSIDHCHETGKIRGVLCGNCNVGLGMFRHDPDLIQKAINYLSEVK